MMNTVDFFKWEHLPEGKMQEASSACAGLAVSMDSMLVGCPEKSAGMRKLLEAKDCFVRATMQVKGDVG